MLSQVDIFDGEYAEKIRFVNAKTYENFEELHLRLACRASRRDCKLTLQDTLLEGTKHVLDKGEDLTTDQALRFCSDCGIQVFYLISEDLREGSHCLYGKKKA